MVVVVNGVVVVVVVVEVVVVNGVSFVVVAFAALVALIAVAWPVKHKPATSSSKRWVTAGPAT